MNTAAGSLIVIAVLVAALWFGIRWLVRSSSKYRGTRIVTCPETNRPAVVEVDALHASLTSTVGLPDLRLQECTRWPIKEQCGQECLMDLDVASEGCLVSGVLMRWYSDKNCVYCKKTFPELHWLDHRPALLSPDGKLLSWNEVNLDKLRNVLETHSPVCWDCYIAQRFRLDHPELVVFRPGRNGISGDADGSSVSRHR
jgi:hypothetical protein